MVSPRITRSSQATVKSTDQPANSNVALTASIEDGDTDADGQENLPDDTIVASGLGPDDHTSPERSINQEEEGGGDGAGVSTTSLSAKMQRILMNVHQAWDVADVNTLLNAAICPSVWTERPAKELSKLARATGVDQRAWAIDQLQQLAGGRPLTKSIIQQVYEKAVAEGKIDLGRSRTRPRAPASVPHTPKARGQQQQQPQTRTNSGQLREASVGPATGRAASYELGQSPSPNSRLPTQEAQENAIESDLASRRDTRSRPRSSQLPRVFDNSRNSRNSRDVRDLRDLSSSHFPSSFGRQPPPSIRSEAAARLHNNPPSHLHQQYRSHHHNNFNIMASNVSNEESVPVNASAPAPSPTGSSQQTPRPTSSPHSLSIGASTSTTIDGPRTGVKRKAAALIEQAREQSEADIKSAQYRLKTLEAKNNELKFGIARFDNEAESALRDISDIEAQIAHQKSELSSTEKLFNSIIASIDGSDPQARQALVQCQHQKQPPFLDSSNIRHDIVTGGMDAASLTDLTQDNTITASPAERCVPCQFKLWQTASQAECSARKQEIQELEARRAQAAAAQQEQCRWSSRLKEEIAIRAKEMEALREEIEWAQVDIDKMGSILRR